MVLAKSRHIYVAMSFILLLFGYRIEAQDDSNVVVSPASIETQEPGSDTDEVVLNHERAEQLFASHDCEALLNQFDVRQINRISQPNQRIDIWRYIAICDYLNEQSAGSDDALNAILKEDVDYELPPFDTPNGVLKRFSELKIAYLRKIKELEQAREKAQAPVVEDNKTIAEPRAIKRRRFGKGLMLLPFGGPQFVLGNRKMGRVHAVTQTVGLALNAGAFWGMQILKDDRGYVNQVEDVQRYERLWNLHILGLGVTILSYGISAVDGLLSYDSSESESE